MFEASSPSTCVCVDRFRVLMLFWIMARGCGLHSTKVTNAAPRERASSPIAPVPAKRSRTLAFSISVKLLCVNMLKMPSRVLSEVGLR